MSAIQKKSLKSHLAGDKKDQQSTTTSHSGFVKTNEGFTNVVPMDKTRGAHNKLLTRKRKKSRHPLRELRLQRGYTLEELAELTRLSPSYLSRLESGSRRLNADILNRIAFVLSCHPGDLLPHDSHTSKFTAQSALQDEAAAVSLPQDLPLYTLDVTSEGTVKLNTQCAEAWIARPPEVFGIARAFAFKASSNDVHWHYSKADHVFTHPTRSLTPHCQMVAINANDQAWVGRFKGWTSDESGHPKALEMTVYEKTATGFQETTIEIERSDLKASYRIIGAIEAA
jgi:transcriptional regulator with XRE-family HTH domain